MGEVAPLCTCHGVEMYRNNSVGGWRCRVKVRARQRAADLIYWHRADGGYVRRRKHHLAQQREQILVQLKVIEEEILESE